MCQIHVTQLIVYTSTLILDGFRGRHDDVEGLPSSPQSKASKDARVQSRSVAKPHKNKFVIIWKIGFLKPILPYQVLKVAVKCHLRACEKCFLISEKQKILRAKNWTLATTIS